jgi:signal transduction histidine kinase
VEPPGSAVATSGHDDLRHVVEQEALAQLALSILRGDNLASVWESALYRLSAVLSAGLAEVLELDTFGPRLVVRATTGWNDTLAPSLSVPVRLDRPPWSEVLRAGVTAVIKRRSRPGAWERVLAKRNVEGSAYGLICTRGRAFGILAVHRDSSPFTCEDLQFLGGMAELVGHAIESARHARLEAEAEHVTGVVHDVNNVLAVIQGYVEMLVEKVGDASPLFDELDAIHRATARASALVSQFVVLNDQDALEGNRSRRRPLAPLLPLANGG